MKVVENVSIQDKPQNAPKPDNLARAANRLRQKLRPAEPQDCDFELTADFLPADFLVADIRMDDARHVVMETAELSISNKELVCRWHIQGCSAVIQATVVHTWIYCSRRSSHSSSPGLCTDVADQEEGLSLCACA